MSLPQPSGRLLVAACMVVVGAGAGCSRRPPDATPEAALRMFLEDMEASEDDPQALRRAYDRLAPAARSTLTERARRAGELQGRHLDPWDMIAPGFFGMAFRPKVMKATVLGSHAVVEVLGDHPQSEHARVACVAEGEGWRVDPGLPAPQ